MRPPLLYHIYAGATAVLLPFFAWNETRKLRAAGVDVFRCHEKLGHATEQRRGSGPLVWFHAASVGESMSVLSLISEMGKQAPRLQFLLTSGTATSAQMVADSLPARTIHQFAPLDGRGPVRRFLDHWRPDGAVFVESELWPQMLRMTKDSGARMVLVNARLSERSRAAWRKRARTSAFVLDSFDLILTQNDDMAQAMVDMHAPVERVARGVNLKALSAPLRQDPAVLAQVRTALKGRPIWVAASTHPGEEAVVLNAHRRLLSHVPDLLLLLAPRHPSRSRDVADIISQSGLSFAVRSSGALPNSVSVYLADTLGELGNWYALSDIIFLGGSLMPVGGHNPFEVAQSGSGVLSGTHVSNFSETYAEMTQNAAAVLVDDEDALVRTVLERLSNREAVDASGRAARDYVRSKAVYLETIAQRVLRALRLDGE